MFQSFCTNFAGRNEKQTGKNVKRNICIVTGARPNFVKVAPILKALERAREQGREVDYQLVYAGTEKDSSLEPTLFEDLQIQRPDFFLGVDCENINELTGRVMSEFEQYLNAHPTDVVIVVDDLASTMAVAIVTKKRGIRLAHLVAGTRSFDITMPKEINRLVIDGLSDLLFTAGMSSNTNATREGAELHKIYMVGNILMDTLRLAHGRLRRPSVLDKLGLKEGEYLVFTLNRKALLANKELLGQMVEALLASGLPVVAPLRSEAVKVVSPIIASDEHSQFHFVSPLSYLEFGWLTAHAKGIVTDSGNVAEEATFNSVPCITLNSYTEHIETVKVGSNVLVGEDAERLREALDTLKRGEWKPCSLPERWDGRTAERIVKTILES